MINIDKNKITINGEEISYDGLKISKRTIIRIVLWLASIICAGLNKYGINIIPNHDIISNVVTYAFLFAAGAWGLWKNESITKAAQIADLVIAGIKNMNLDL